MRLIGLLCVGRIDGRRCWRRRRAGQGLPLLLLLLLRLRGCFFPDQPESEIEAAVHRHHLPGHANLLGVAVDHLQSSDPEHRRVVATACVEVSARARIPVSIVFVGTCYKHVSIQDVSIQDVSIQDVSIQDKS